MTTGLERDVVVAEAVVGTVELGRVRAAAAHRVVALAAAAEQQHAVGPHVEARARLPLAIGVLAGAELAFDHHLLALLQEGLEGFGLASPQADAEPLREFLLVAVPAGPLLVGGERELE